MSVGKSTGQIGRGETVAAGGGEGAGVIRDNGDDGDGGDDSDGSEDRCAGDGGDDGDDGDAGDNGKRGGERSVWLESFKNPRGLGRKSMHMHILHCEVVGGFGEKSEYLDLTAKPELTVTIVGILNL